MNIYVYKLIVIVKKTDTDPCEPILPPFSFFKTILLNVQQYTSLLECP